MDFEGGRIGDHQKKVQHHSAPRPADLGLVREDGENARLLPQADDLSSVYFEGS